MVHACIMFSILLYIDNLLESLMELFCCLGVLVVDPTARSRQI